jgi:hypothetical protein
VRCSESDISIDQAGYAREILDKFGYANAHPVGNPLETRQSLVAASENDTVDHSFDYRGAVGMLMYLATCTRPDLAYAVGQLSRHVAAPTKQHVGCARRVLGYLAGTLEYGIKYTRARDQGEQEREVKIEGYCDSDWASDQADRKSTGGFVFCLAGGAITWSSRKQPVIALSTAEAKYVAACEAATEAVGQRNVATEVLPHMKVTIRIGMDSQSAYVMASNPTYSRRTRHIELRWHFIREQVKIGSFKLEKIPGEDNPAAAFTKALDGNRLKRLMSMIGVSVVLEDGVQG